jgi:hypothetical protein
VSANAALAGDAATGSALSGTLGLDIALIGQAATASELAGALTVGLPLAGNAHSASQLAGDLWLTKQFAGEAGTGSALSGTLSVAATIPLAGSAHTGSMLSPFGQAVLRVHRPLAGNAHTGSALGGTVALGNIVWQVSGVAWSASYLTGTLTVTHTAAASGGNVTAGEAKAVYGPADIPPARIPRRWPPRY